MTIYNEHYYKRIKIRGHKRKSANGKVYGVTEHYRYIPIRKTTVMNKIKRQLYQDQHKE